MIQIQIDHLGALPQAAQTFLTHIDHRKVFAFEGSMGAGKTTFIKALCNVMGVEDVVNSPTFAIVNEYSTRDNATIFHFDCYRIETLEEAYDFGAEDYLYSGHLCFIEWPQNIEGLLPDDTRYVRIRENPDGSRTITMDA